MRPELRQARPTARDAVTALAGAAGLYGVFHVGDRLARVVMPHGGAVLVTVISLMTVLSLVNATLLMAPRILLADEPTGNLDPRTSEHVFNALGQLVRASGLAACSVRTARGFEASRKVPEPANT